MPTAPTLYFKGAGIIPLYSNKEPKIQSVQLPASVVYPAGTILGEKIGISDVETITLGTQSSGTFTVTVNGQTTSAVAFNATGATLQTALLLLSSVSANAVQVVTLTSATGGSFTLAYLGQTTNAIAYNATAATVQTALLALPNVPAGTIAVTGSAGGPYTITFSGALGAQPIALLGVGGASLTPSTATIAATQTAVGSVGNNLTCTGSAGGPYTVTFQNALANQAVTVTCNFASLTTPGNASLAHTTVGSPGTPGTFAAYAVGSTDGSQLPRAVLQYDCATDASGNITFGLVAGTGEFAQTLPTAPAFFAGVFKAQELIGLDANCFTVQPSWKLISGSIPSGVVELP